MTAKHTRCEGECTWSGGPFVAGGFGGVDSGRPAGSTRGAWPSPEVALGAKWPESCRVLQQERGPFFRGVSKGQGGGPRDRRRRGELGPAKVTSGSGGLAVRRPRTGSGRDGERHRPDSSSSERSFGTGRRGPKASMRSGHLNSPRAPSGSQCRNVRGESRPSSTSERLPGGSAPGMPRQSSAAEARTRMAPRG